MSFTITVSYSVSLMTMFGDYSLLLKAYEIEHVRWLGGILGLFLEAC